jgi:hypothetical protein
MLQILTEPNFRFYINLTTQQSQWVNPLGQLQQPVSPPQYGVGVPPTADPGVPQYAPAAPQQELIPGQQQNTPPPGADRGLGKGLLGMAGGLLAGAVVNHEIDEHKDTFGFTKFFAHNSTGGSGGLLSGLGRGGPGGLISSFGGGAAGGVAGAAAAPSVGGGMFSGAASHMPFGAASGPPLHIHCAAYGDVDVTQTVRRLVTGGTTLSLDADKLPEYFGDPWPENRGQFSIIYSYGQRPWELIASADRCGILSLIPHQPLDTERMKFIQDNRSRVIAVVWGTGNGLEKGKGPIVKLQQIETTGEFPATNDWFDFDGMHGPAKNAIVYYRAGNGVAISTAREGGTVRMPWNPLARWT